MTRVAVLIPSYNSSATVAATLQSVAALEPAGLAGLTEVCLADDDSRDDTVRVAQSAWKAAPALRVLRGERNLGERGNVNKAMELLARSADWVLLLHSDDLVKPIWLRVMMERIAACSPSVASVCSSWDTLHPDGTITPGEDSPARPVEVIAGDAKTVRGTLMRGCWWHISGCAIRVEAFKDIGPFAPDMPQLGDWEWLLRCLQRGWSVEYVPRTLLVYREHPNSVSSQSFLLDRDVREKVSVLRRYADVLSARDFARLHLRMGWWLTRRLGRATMSHSAQRIFRTLESLAVVARSGVSCLWRRGLTRRAQEG